MPQVLIDAVTRFVATDVGETYLSLFIPHGMVCATQFLRFLLVATGTTSHVNFTWAPHGMHWELCCCCRSGSCLQLKCSSNMSNKHLNKSPKKPDAKPFLAMGLSQNPSERKTKTEAFTKVKAQCDAEAALQKCEQAIVVDRNAKKLR